ncbi:hypothetical protein ACCO45_011397 [Purpureocillium lilacinum]|uniref:Uncharacterized protein n=1 Tax=Purpureocillium lilacinum TaxID=33203 RepID=A0ACC4DD97_PURLI
MGGAADTSSTVGSRVVLSATRERGARNMDRCWGSPALEVPAWLKKLRAGSGSGRASVICPAQSPPAVPRWRSQLGVHPASGAEPRGTEYDGSPRSGTASVRTPPLVFLLLLTAPAEQDDSVGDPRDNPRRLSTPSRGRQWTSVGSANSSAQKCPANVHPELNVTLFFCFRSQAAYFVHCASFSRARAAFELEYRARLCTCNVIATAAAPTTSHGVSQSLDINIILRLREDGGKEKNPDFRSQAARHSYCT